MSETSKLQPLTEEDLTQVSGGTGVNMQNIQSMDIETALMMVQGERTAMLDQQLQTQAGVVAQRNETIGALNGALQVFTAIGQGMSSGQTVTGSAQAQGQEKTLDSAIDTLKTLGVETNTLKEFANNGFSKEELAQIATFTKASIDAQGNSQQMDMLRLQSMSNKRNEAFDVMTNFVQKMQSSRSSIIGNMR